MKKDNFVIHFTEPPATAIVKSYEMFDPPYFNVYLASAITGRSVRENIVDKRNRKIIKGVLENYDYMGMFCKVYDPEKITGTKSEHTSEQVYAIDHGETISSDLVVFYINSISFGMGVEAQIAADSSIPRVIIRPKELPVSRMIIGLFNPTLRDISYRNINELKTKLSESMGDIMGILYEYTQIRRDIISNLKNVKINEFIFRQRIIKNITRKELSSVVGIRPYWIEIIEMDPKKCATLTNLQIYLISEILKAKIEMSEGGYFKMSSRETEAIETHIKASILNLQEFLIEMHNKKRTIKDDVVLKEWKNYYNRVSQVEAARGKKIMTKEDWKKAFDKPTLF